MLGERLALLFKAQQLPGSSMLREHLQAQVVKDLPGISLFRQGREERVLKLGPLGDAVPAIKLGQGDPHGIKHLRNAQVNNATGNAPVLLLQRLGIGLALHDLQRPDGPLDLKR